MKPKIKIGDYVVLNPLYTDEIQNKTWSHIDHYKDAIFHVKDIRNNATETYCNICGKLNLIYNLYIPSMFKIATVVYIKSTPTYLYET